MDNVSPAEPLLTQAQLELEMYAHGRNRADYMMRSNEEAGRAANNPYAQAIYRRFILPLSEIVRGDINTPKPGRNKAHVTLLRPMDPDVVAFIAVRGALATLLAGIFNDTGSARRLAAEVGRACYHELLLSLFEIESPALFYTLVNDLGRRRSKSERHRMTVFKLEAKRNGITFPEWGEAGLTQVGAYLVNCLEQLGMLETSQSRGKRGTNSEISVRLSTDTLELIQEIKGFVVESMPYFIPCVEPPRPWQALDDGGFHTPALRRLQPWLIKGSSMARERMGNVIAQPVLDAVNHLQAVRWQINPDILAAVTSIARHFDMDEIVSQAELPGPPRPEWLLPDMTKETMTPEQLSEFAAWRREKAEWFTEMRLRGIKFGRFDTALKIARKFVNYPAIYFVYYADFRGRLYVRSTGVTPQGSDMQKALLRFADGKSLDTPEAQEWFMIHGANKFGYDKAGLADRVRWVRERDRFIRDYAADPVNNDGWREADCPLQFLAWCQEYARWKEAGEDFVSHIPVSMDGTCNGLQNFSAMLRDEVGGRATNLLDSDLPNDIYQQVADRTATLLQDAYDDEAGYRGMWLRHGMNRSLVKRSVMTLPYGATRFSCADFIVQDYLRVGKAKEIAREDYHPAAQWLSHFVWRAIGDVVVKATEAMAWLQRSSRIILRAGNDLVEWVAPSGFHVVQDYAAMQVYRIRSLLHGNAQLQFQNETDSPSAADHRNGIAPNFIHTHDAAHLTLVAASASRMGMALAMIHDDYGTHAADAEDLFHLIRAEFVDMYERCDPLQTFADKYDLPEPPARGGLDIREVASATYFFC